MRIGEAAYKFIHNNGCGAVAFYHRVKPEPNMVVEVANVVFPDGSQPKTGDPFRCGTCGQLLDPILDMLPEFGQPV